MLYPPKTQGSAYGLRRDAWLMEEIWGTSEEIGVISMKVAPAFPGYTLARLRLYKEG